MRLKDKVCNHHRRQPWHWLRYRRQIFEGRCYGNPDRQAHKVLLTKRLRS